MDKVKTIDEYLLELIRRSMPLGLSPAEMIAATLGDDFDGDLDATLATLAEDVPPRVKLAGGRWVLCEAANQPKRSLLLGTGRDPSRAFGTGLGAGMSMIVPSRGGRKS